MNWTIVKEWLIAHGNITEDWNIEVGDDSIYCSDEDENTFISVFTRGDGELIIYVGMLKPKFTCGSDTGVYVSSPYDVTDFLHDHLEDMFEELMIKFEDYEKMWASVDEAFKEVFGYDRHDCGILD